MRRQRTSRGGRGAPGCEVGPRHQRRHKRLSERHRRQQHVHHGPQRHLSPPPPPPPLRVNLRSGGGVVVVRGRSVGQARAGGRAVGRVGEGAARNVRNGSHGCAGRRFAPSRNAAGDKGGEGFAKIARTRRRAEAPARTKSHLG